MSVKWGVLGTANIARGCTIPGMKMAENCELYAIAGRNEARAHNPEVVWFESRLRNQLEEGYLIRGNLFYFSLHSEKKNAKIF